MLNGSTDSDMNEDHWSLNKIVRVLVLTVIMLITFTGNSYMIIKLLFYRHRTRLQLFILNLAFGDLAVCVFTMTSELFLLIHDQEWILGNTACKITLYIQVVTLASTTFIHVAMTYDRYEAICCPFRARRSFGHIRFIILLCWLSSFIVAIPQLFIFQLSASGVSPTVYRCASTGYTAEWQRRVYFTTFAMYVLILPAICMTYWYIKIVCIVSKSKTLWTQSAEGQSLAMSPALLASSTKIKTVKLAMTIIIVFVASWTPYMVVTLIEVYSNQHFHTPPWLDGVLQTVCLVQSGLNPFVYIFFNRHQKRTAAAIRIAASIGSQTSERRKNAPYHEIGSSFGGHFKYDLSRRKIAFTFCNSQ